jgi:hypothetical protein
MVDFEISRESFNNFLSSFGKDLGDLVIKVTGEGITASVGQPTHYIRRGVLCGTGQTGNVYLSDIPKLKSFLSTSKSADLNISQSDKTGTLHVQCDKSSLQLPTSSYIKSNEMVGAIEKVIRNSEESMWQKWSYTDLNYHAKVTAESLKPATGFKKVLGDKYSCKTEFDPSASEFVIRGGKSATGKMFVKAPLTNVSSPDRAAKSAFDKWLPELLSNIPNGEIDLYTGDETVLVLSQPSTNFLMVVMDQEYEED